MPRSQSTVEPLFGDTRWLMELTGFSHDTIARLCRRKAIPGAFRLPGSNGKNSPWRFDKVKTLAWVKSLGSTETGSAKRAKRDEVGA
jgi:hypothetical protein